MKATPPALVTLPFASTTVYAALTVVALGYVLLFLNAMLTESALLVNGLMVLVGSSSLAIGWAGGPVANLFFIAIVLVFGQRPIEFDLLFPAAVLAYLICHLRYATLVQMESVHAKRRPVPWWQFAGLTWPSSGEAAADPFARPRMAELARLAAALALFPLTAAFVWQLAPLEWFAFHGLTGSAVYLSGVVWLIGTVAFLMRMTFLFLGRLRMSRAEAEILLTDIAWKELHPESIRAAKVLARDRSLSAFGNEAVRRPS